MDPLPSSSSSAPLGKATVGNATNRTAQSEEQSQVSNGKKAAMIGGSIAGGIVAAILLAVSFWLFRRRQAGNRDSMLYPDKFSPSAQDLDEKTFDWGEKRPLSTAAGPAGGLPRSHGVANLHKRQISRQDSLESFTEAFQPETLRHQPTVEPYYPGQFTPSHSANPSMSSSINANVEFSNMHHSPPRAARNIANPFDVAPLKTKTSYENRLAAASASLPDFHDHARPIPRQPRTLLQPAPRVYSEASSAYPATEARESHVDRHSTAYSGIEMEGDEEEEAYANYQQFQNSPVGFGGVV